MEFNTRHSIQQNLPAEVEFIDTNDYKEFKSVILRKTGIDLNLYKQQQMHRRLQGLLEKNGCRDFLEYCNILLSKPGALEQFLDRMTINVSELFRNPEKWAELRTQILPGLLSANRQLRIWSAGCSFGAEPYSLAILLDKIAPGIRFSLDATDLDKTILEKAKEGKFSSQDVQNVDKADLQKYFCELPASDTFSSLEAKYQVNQSIRAKVNFRPHNLLADPFEQNYDLICCRNVVIYFTDEAKQELYKKFCNALRPKGVLFVGGTERIFGYQSLGFDTSIPFFYYRSASAKQAAA